MMNGKSILLVLGGIYHDFDGFAAAMTPVLEAAGYTVRATYNLDDLIRLEESRPDVVLLYTSLSAPREGETRTAGHTPAQVEALVRWVRGGGRLMGVHAATVAGQFSVDFKALLGGAFISHPPQFSFTVYPLYHEHPITAGIEAFTVHDEFYVQQCDESIRIHMVALDRGIAHPMVWSKAEGLGRVAYVAMGHGLEVWTLEPYRRLVLQGVDWVTE
jgi:type 1 glutamine amidotransferase